MVTVPVSTVGVTVILPFLTWMGMSGTYRPLHDYLVRTEVKAA